MSKKSMTKANHIAVIIVSLLYKIFTKIYIYVITVSWQHCCKLTKTTIAAVLECWIVSSVSTAGTTTWWTQYSSTARIECWVKISFSTAWTSTRWCQHTIAACVECWVIISCSTARTPTGWSQYTIAARIEGRVVSSKTTYSCIRVIDKNHTH